MVAEEDGAGLQQAAVVRRGNETTRQRDNETTRHQSETGTEEVTRKPNSLPCAYCMQEARFEVFYFVKKGGEQNRTRRRCQDLESLQGVTNAGRRAAFLPNTTAQHEISRLSAGGYQRGAEDGGADVVCSGLCKAETSGLGTASAREGERHRTVLGVSAPSFLSSIEVLYLWRFGPIVHVLPQAATFRSVVLREQLSCFILPSPCPTVPLS